MPRRQDGQEQLEILLGAMILDVDLVEQLIEHRPVAVFGVPVVQRQTSPLPERDKVVIAVGQLGGKVGHS